MIRLFALLVLLLPLTAGDVVESDRWYVGHLNDQPAMTVHAVVVVREAAPSSMENRLNSVAETPPTLKRSSYFTPVDRLRSDRCVLAFRPNEMFSQYDVRAVM